MSGSVKKMLFRHAVLVVAGGGSPHGQREEGVLDRMEAALVAAGGGNKVSISLAKKLLREKGEAGQVLASRLGRLSKVRNGKAHPDVSLEADIKAFIDEMGHEEMQQEVVTEKIGNEIGKSRPAPGGAGGPLLASKGISGEEEAEHHEEHDTELEGNEQSEGVGSGYSGIETKELKDICVKATASIDEKLRSGELDPAVLAAVVKFAANNLGKESEMEGKKPSGKGFG